MGEWMDAYIEGQDRDYDRAYSVHKSVMQEYIEAKDKEEDVADDRSVMDIYIESKDAEDD